jgi:hypothetical protein
MNYFSTSVGMAIIAITVADFLYTTLSFNGAGPLTKWGNRGLMLLTRRFKGDWKRFSGLVHMCVTLLVWFVFIMVGGYLVFISEMNLVVDTGLDTPAGGYERFYFTTYLFSTMGNGNLSPGNNFSLVFSGIYSIIGFITVTTALAFSLAVIDAVNQKKNLAVFISHMGNTPVNLYHFATAGEGAEKLIDRIDDVIQLLDQHANNHLSFPIIHHYLTSYRERCAPVFITALNEVVHVLLTEFKDDKPTEVELLRLKRTIDHFMTAAQKEDPTGKGDSEVAERERMRWVRLGFTGDKAIDWNRDETDAFSGLLNSAGWDWQGVYAEHIVDED